MRDINYLIQLFPDKTGKELLAIQAQDKLDDQKEFDELNKEKLAYIKDLNENGGYFCGRFGIDQHYYYHVYNLVMDNKGRITMDVDKVVLFYNDSKDTHQVTRPNEIRMERRIKEYQEFDKYGLEHEKRVTKKEWDAVNDYLNKMSELFWGHIKPV